MATFHGRMANVWEKLGMLFVRGHLVKGSTIVSINKEPFWMLRKSRDLARTDA